MYCPTLSFSDIHAFIIAEWPAGIYWKESLIPSSSGFCFVFSPHMWCIWDPGCSKFPVSSLPDSLPHHRSFLLPEAPRCSGTLVTRSFYPVWLCNLCYAVVFCFSRNFTVSREGVLVTLILTVMRNFFCLKPSDGFLSGMLKMKCTTWSWFTVLSAVVATPPNIYPVLPFFTVFQKPWFPYYPQTRKVCSVLYSVYVI